MPVSHPLGANIDFLFLIEILSGGLFSVDSSGGWLNSIWTFYSTVAFVVSGILIFGIIYSYMRFNQLVAGLVDKIDADERLWQELYGGRVKNARWLEVQSHIDSNNPNDWKLAIIESDILLGQALTEAGYAGDSIGEQLKGITPSNLSSIQEAWDAHKI